MGGMVVPRGLMILVVLIVCLATSVLADADDNDDRISDFPVSAPAPSPDQAPMSPINKKVYACGERCVNRYMKESSEYPVYSKCTTTCMEPCIRTLVDGVYSSTFGCTKSLST
ncbi:unnamed protein product [Prunus armeniaca]|uniref:Prolamin-like domain-containing protein n=1 Tax=Prunus armeniaca TaxID=36596 RepID=A0A6J5WTA1_PRUAR|nr:unnamed protein product [Prunus armeniaca]